MAYHWPTTLPTYPLLDGYKRTIPNNTIRSSMDTGSDKVRKRGGSKPQVLDVTYVLTTDQLHDLEAFIRDVAQGGAVCFDWPHPETGIRVRTRLKPKSEGAFEITRYKDTTRWQVQLEMEVWPDAPTDS